MQRELIRLYVLLVVSLALLSVWAQDWVAFLTLPGDVLLGLAFLTALGLVSEGAALRPVLGRETSTSSITFLPLLACVLLFGPAASVVFFAITGVVAEFLIRRKDALRAIFNSAQYVLCTAVAGLAFSIAGGQPLVQASEFTPQLGPLALFGVTFLALNNALVFVAISLTSQEARAKETFFRLVQEHRGSFVHDLLISPLGILFAFLYFQLGVLGLAVSLLPLLFVRHSYLSKFLLERANRDLLKVLVKAIETRDPYTSGHSMRVQALSERIGHLMGLSGRRIEELSASALLHDIGKIEDAYEEFLRKPGGLSLDEQRVMESHVTRGVEILTSLTSFPPAVIDGVRHHHESMNGSGYPFGLKGEAIHVYGRIIRVSDAIDAMLSDRPYRKALTVTEVYQELRLFAGTQFDPHIVELVSKGQLVEDHSQRMTATEHGAETMMAKRWITPSPIVGRGPSPSAAEMS